MILKKEWILSCRSLGDLFQPVLFLLLLTSLFPIALNSDTNILSSLAPAIVWSCILLSIILSCDKCFHEDFADGSLEQLLLSKGLYSFIVAKAVVVWLTKFLPMLLALPLLALYYHFSWAMCVQFILTLVIASPTLILFALLGATLTLTLSRGAILSSIITVPLYIPVIIFSLSALSAFNNGFSNHGQLALLGAFCLTSAAFLPFVIATLIKTVIAYR